jgi:hypothetical protein
MNVLEVNRRTFAPDSPGWLAMQQAFREMGDAGARHCRPVLLILYPYLFPGHWTLETYPERDIHQRVAAAAGSAGFDVLDLAANVPLSGQGLEGLVGDSVRQSPGWDGAAPRRTGNCEPYPAGGPPGR